LALNWAVAIRGRYSVTLGLHQRIISLPGIETSTVHLESLNSLTSELDAIEPQLVIHSAGLASVETCEANPDLAQHINVDLATNVARACARIDLPLVHVSTDHLFSGDDPLVDEGHPTAPVNVYGRTKAEAEVRVLDAHSAVLVARTNFFGWGPRYRSSFSDVIVRSLSAGQEIPLFRDVYYTPILIETLAMRVDELVGMGASGIFHVAGDNRISKYEFGLEVAKQFELDSSLIKSTTLTDRSGLVRRPHDMSLSNQKASALLGKTLGSVEQDLATLCQQQQRDVTGAIRAL